MITSFPISGTGTPQTQCTTKLQNLRQHTDMETNQLIVYAGKTSCLKFGKDAKYVAAGLVDSSKLLLFTSPKEDMEY